MLGTARIEPLLRRIRNDMTGAGLSSSRPRASATSASTRSPSATTRRCRTCDGHVVYKNGAKEIAAQEGMALTFMAKFDAREGNSCHIHCSFRGTDGAMVMADGDGHVGARASRSSPGSSRYMRELTLLLAPNINSYKRYVEGSLRPDRAALGPRQPHLRVPAGRPRRRRCGWRTGSPAAT